MRNTRLRAPVVAVVALLSALPALPTATPEAFSATLPWWNDYDLDDKDIDKGFHLRALVHVHNPHPYDLENAPVAAELDVLNLLVDAGWPHVHTARQDQLKSFHIDPNSIRVVPLVDSSSGRFEAVDPESHPTLSDPARYEAPSASFEGALAGQLAAPFNPRTNPYLTVVWRVPGVLHQGQTVPYMVYFDTLTNGNPHDAPRYSGTPAAGSLQAVFWSGPALTLYGVVTAGDATSAGTVMVVGLHPNTNVTVYAADTDGPRQGIYEKTPSSESFPNPFTVGEDNHAPAFIATLAAGEAKVFRLESNRPILAVGRSTGFVPSLDGGALGKEFLFALTQDQTWEQDTVYFISASDRPTTVEVQRLSNGSPAATYNFLLNVNGTNPFPYSYSRSARASGFNEQGSSRCQPTPNEAGGYAPLLPLGPGLFRARVTKGDPVLLQLQPSGGMSQAPSVMGEPTGTSFLAATGWSDMGGMPLKPCVKTDRPGSLLAMSLEGESTLLVTSPDADRQIYPLGSTTNRNPPIPDPPCPSKACVPASPRVLGPVPTTIPGTLDRPLHFTAQKDAPIVLFVGQDPAVTGIDMSLVQRFPSYLTPTDGRPIFDGSGAPILHGPLWGAGLGQKFVGVGDVLLIAPFPDTHALATLRYSDGTQESRGLHLTPGGAEILRGNGARLESYLIESVQTRRPLLAYPLAGTATFLAGVPAFLNATVQGAEYRGRLVRIASADGRDPLPGSAEPDADATYRLLVTNLGRDMGGKGLADDILVSVENPDPNNWTTSLEGRPNGIGVELTGVPPGAPQEVVLTVRNRTARPDRERIDFQVVATSKNSPGQLVQDRLQVAHSLTSGISVGLWFDAVGGPTEMGLRTEPHTPVTYTLVTKNLGSKNVNVTLTLQGGEEGWTNRLLLDGREVDSGIVLPLPRGRQESERRLQLDVTPPPPGLSGVSSQQILRIRAVPREEPASFKSVDATTTVALSTNVRIDPQSALLYAEPGSNATFFLNVTNKGAGSPSMAFQVISDAPASWSKPLLYREDGLLLAPTTETSVDSAGLGLRVLLSVPEGEPAGKLVAVRLGGRQTDGGSCGICESILYVLVRPQHRLESGDLPPVLASSSGENLTIQIALDNHGNLDEDLEPVVLSLPAQWRAFLPTAVVVPRNGTATFPATLAAARNAPPGLYNVTFGLVSEDGHVTPFPFQVQIGATGHATAGAVGAVLAQPGGLAEAAFPLRNDGNTPLVVKVESAGGERWHLQQRPPPFRLGPGTATTLHAAWQVPRDAPDGTSTHRFRLVLEPAGGGAPLLREESASVAVGRSDLRWEETVRAFPGAAGMLVRGLVANRGDRPATDVEAVLRVGERVVGNVTVGLVPAGGTANVTLLLPRGQAGEAQVFLDPRDRIVERDESNNMAQVAGADTQRSSVVAVAGLLLVFLAAAARRRRP